MLSLFLLPAVLLATVVLSGCGGDNSSSESAEAGQSPGDAPSFEPSNRLPYPVTALSHARAAPCPEEMAQVGDACVDRYEAHLIVDQKVHPPSHRPPRETPFKAGAAPNLFPQAYISKTEAADACRRSQKRLCTLAEWLRACKGSQGFLYSYGKEEEKGRCNHGKPHLMMQLFKDKPTIAWTYEDFNDPALNEMPGFLGKSAEYFGCANDYGIFDMVGNLHEWVSDVVDSGLPNRIHLNKALTKKYKENLGFGIFMGGFYSTNHEHGSGCEFITIGHEEKYHDYSTGFRCCQDAQK